ncbi:adenylate cyclase [Alteromonas macleodii str. 'Black Sea 11']|jgi:adenylate cyclase class 1|uniref:class I adenylate cyclase n=1 Tax=Alteromonas abrolhosensis TaxID=1892904 RepID=UPI000286E7DD|nr:adenylate cyclase [Alteromonas macleodii str. 'Black Sea 11']NKW89637.1 class I adenylate cyclase [Alteromonadaceae bacterium A_SAG4]NKX33751.1 class I adenylate cyclase [Alteromonadaceae bacterium A_SAG3]
MAAQQPLSVQQNLTIRLLRVLRYNKARIERALTLMPEKHRPLFHVLPFLVHVNHEALPGYVTPPTSDETVPFGINNYSFRPDVELALKRCFPAQSHLFADIKQIWPRQRAVDALVLMGSVGTIAQTDDSDFDFWVCIDGNRFSQAALALLQQKLTAIEKWADETFGIEVHFFLSEIDKVRQNDFGVAEGESAGSAQAMFLKAEFYNTNIVVAGKAPFWWLTPEKTTEKQYRAIYNSLEKGGSPDVDWFMDLGHLERLDASELFGAAIWQLGKAMDSPFKSVLKMAKLEVYLANISHGQPLCNLLKKHVHRGAEAPGHVADIDPYALMFDELIAHYKKHGQAEDIAVLQQCLYLKCGSALSQPLVEGEQANFKRKIMASYAKQWGWSRKLIVHLDNQQDWTFNERVQLSRRIHRFLLKCYRRISKEISHHQQVMDQKDMTVLGRRLSTYYAKKADKIEFLRRAFDESLYCEKITIAMRQLKNGDEVWSAYAGDLLSKSGIMDESQKITQASTAIALMVWLVSSKIIDTNSKVYLDYNYGEVSELDLNDLLKHLCKYFPPVKVSSLPRNDLLAPERVTACFAIVNFPTLRQKATVEDVSILYTTSWGETFLKHGDDVLDTLWYDLQEVTPKPPCYVMVPRGNQQSRILGEFLEANELNFTVLY